MTEEEVPTNGRRRQAKIFEIREEKDELLASRECCVCLEAVKSCVLRPCLHMCVCSDCAKVTCVPLPIPGALAPEYV